VAAVLCSPGTGPGADRLKSAGTDERNGHQNVYQAGEEEEVPLNWNDWIRQIHRWLSIVFTAVVTAIFVSLGAGVEPAYWVYLMPLIPLGLLALSGLYLFALPYATRWRSRTA
jgi:hypothetical protein